MTRWHRLIVILFVTISLNTILLSGLFQTFSTLEAAGDYVLCVVPAGEPTGPFAACNQVFPSIQTAVDAATPGAEIWVATGIYNDIHEQGGLRQIVYLDKALTLRGGYAAPFTMPPDPVVNPTVLDAGGQGRVVYVVGTAVTLSNFHLTGGNATGLGPLPWDALGGGVYASNASLTLNDSIIYSNTASLNGGGGGGVAVQNGVITMTANTVRDNLAGYAGSGEGGGILVRHSDYYLADNLILSNTAVFTDDGSPDYFTFGLGGGVAVESSDGWLVNNQLADNVALRYGYYGFGGGIYLEQDGEITQSHHVSIESNVIQGNIGAIYPIGGDGEGGGIFLYNPYPSRAPLHATVTDNVIQENVATVYGEWSLSGGIAVYRNTILTFTHNIVISNTSLITGYVGLGGGLVASNVTGTLAYNQFIGNAAAISASGGGDAGGIYFDRSWIEQHNDLIQGNITSQSGAGFGGGIYFDATAATLTNVVVTDNKSNTASALWLGSADIALIHPTLARNLGDNAIYLTTSFESSIPSTIAIMNAIVVSHPVGLVATDDTAATINGILWYDTPTTISSDPLASVTVNHEIVGDPLFAADGYHILPGSAAIGQGVSLGSPPDIDGDPRPLLPALGVDEYWAAHSYLPVMNRSP